MFSKEYTVLISFNTQGFLDACYDLGIKLYKKFEGDTSQGYIVEESTHLQVFYEDDTHWDTIDAKVTEFNV